MPDSSRTDSNRQSSTSAILAAESPINVLIVGVGGQGVIMVSKVLATLCQRQGYQVKQSEVHGMAKRGGSVFSHVRFGEAVYSPTIPLGEADVLVALEWAEGLRWLSYLKPDGIFIADTQQIVPPFACRDRKHGAGSGYARETVADVIEQVANCYAVNAGQIAEELGNSKAGNTLLLGMMSTTLDFPADDWRDAIRMFAPPKALDINMQAFDRGRDWVETRDPSSIVDMPEPIEQVVHEAEFELPVINRAWCKRCDICVKFCPERCLSLDEQQIAVLHAPEKCTLCRICERLCPDFAIDLRYRH